MHVSKSAENVLKTRLINFILVISIIALDIVNVMLHTLYVQSQPSAVHHYISRPTLANSHWDVIHEAVKFTLGSWGQVTSNSKCSWWEIQRMHKWTQLVCKHLDYIVHCIMFQHFCHVRIWLLQMSSKNFANKYNSPGISFIKVNLSQTWAMQIEYIMQKTLAEVTFSKNCMLE